jgi:hypothetical protein
MADHISPGRLVLGTYADGWLAHQPRIQTKRAGRAAIPSLSERDIERAAVALVCGLNWSKAGYLVGITTI